MIEKLAGFLSQSVSALLSDEPFRAWSVERSVETDLEEPVIHYVFPSHGLELQCDAEEKISAIHLYRDEYGGFDQNLLDLSFSFNGIDIARLMGVPSKRGDKVVDPILGEYGAWDRFDYSNHSVHIEYTLRGDGIRMITLIRKDRLP
jgi:hypothetical protein